MKVWVRLSLIASATLLFGIALFGVSAYLLFAEAQMGQLRDLLRRDLDRIQELVSDPVLGAQVFRADDPGFMAQFVSRDGSVVLPPDGGPPLPLHLHPTIDRSGPAPRLVAAASWDGPTGQNIGTIRAAIDLSEALAQRNTLARVLLAAGIAIAALVTAASFAVLRRATDPLSRLASQARAIDPARPQRVEHHGPSDEVADVAAALNEALAAIRARQEAERAALAEIAHELAAPLSVVAGQIRSSRERHPGDPRLEAAHRAAQELLHTSQDLLTLARGELEQSFDLRIVDASDLVREVADEFPGVTVDARRGAEVVGDPLRLKQLIRNLVRNAVQASGGTESVVCRVATQEAAVRIEVEDRGPGIPPDELPRVFDRFFGTRGTAGVGLTVVEQIARRHGGRVGVVSEPGEGARFEVVLPDVASQIDGATAAEATPD